jgi:hypothetical protein
MFRFAIAATVLVLMCGVARGQSLVGATVRSGNTCNLIVIDPTTGSNQVYMNVTLPGPASSQLYQMGAVPGCGLIGNMYVEPSTATGAGPMIVIQPLSGSVSVVAYGAPVSTGYVEGLDYSPRHNAVLVSFGATGNFGTNRLALVNPANGSVISSTAALSGISDLDTIVSSPSEDVFFDLNATGNPRVKRLTALLPNPTFGTFSSPPALQAWFDGAMHPTTGELVFTDGDGSRLVRLVGSAYVPGATLANGARIRGLAWANLPPRVQPFAPVAICPGGSVSIPATVPGTPPYSNIWEIESPVGSGTFVPLVNGTFTEIGSGMTFTAAATDSQVLQISNLQPGSRGPVLVVRLRTSNSCGESSGTTTLTYCPPDVNCDGALDLFDYLDFVAAFSGNEPSSDFNADTVIDFFDYLDFVDAFAAGC